MNKIVEIIKRKPALFLFVSLGYLLLVGLLKWQLHPPLAALLFLLGGGIGLYLLDAAEVFFALSPSPFRSHLFAAAFAVVALFVLTSSGSLLAQGLVLSIAVTLILRQHHIIYVAVFLIETLLFLAWA